MFKTGRKVKKSQPGFFELKTLEEKNENEDSLDISSELPGDESLEFNLEDE